MLNQTLQSLILEIHRRIFPFPRKWFAATGSDTGSLIYNALRSDTSCLIARFGSIEMESMMAYLNKNNRMPPWERFYRFASWDIRYRGWAEPLKIKLRNNAGVFPSDPVLLDQFARLYLSLAPQIDVLGSWLHAEMLIRDRMPSVKRIPLPAMEPYLSAEPWSKALKGKRVLVIHPFTESILAQYKKRTLLFKNPDVLPDFDLIPLKAVQSAGGEQPPFPDWFAALQYMKDQVSRLDFDVALIGAGAYGLPLAAHVKALGRKAVHLGGVTQMLFGIYGQRWANDPKRKKLINEHWVRPLPSEKTAHANSIENGCYW